MISLLVLSNRDALFEGLRQNAEVTIGCAFELLRDTSVQGGLSAAYNRLAMRAHNSVLCFLHDDVRFHTQGWGPLLLKELAQKETGVVGVMGGRYKSAFGLGWRDGRTASYRYNVLDGAEGSKHLQQLSPEQADNEVLCLDGAFLACRKEVWSEIRFDEAFRGYHFYDIDFTFRVAQRRKNYVLDDVLLKHLSQGHLTAEYLNDSLLFDGKHRALLPRSLDRFSAKETAHLEGYSLTEKMRRLRKEGFPVRLRAQLLQQYLRKHFNFYQLLRNLYFGFFKPQ